MNNIYFEREQVSYVTPGVIISVITFFFLVVLCIAAYGSHHDIAWLILAAVFFIYPLLLFLLRVKYLRYDRDTLFSINLEKHELVYEHKNRHIVFLSTNIEEWICYQYGERYCTYIDILELRLKNGEIIYIHGGVKQICRALKLFRSQLGIPNKDYQYNNWKFLFNHTRKFLHRTDKETI